jgi:surface polysaccharide O-acyltransferase-like enzyme
MDRIESVDVFRLIAIIAVICVHTSPFYGPEFSDNYIYKYLAVIIDQTARFAVPFFFAISGYFWGVKVRGGSDPLFSANKMGKKIVIIFLFWSFIYLLPYNFLSVFKFGILGPIKVAYWHVLNILNSPLSLFVQGTKIHLWFLVGLLCSLYITAFFVKYNAPFLLLIFSIALYVIGVLAKSYADTPFGFYLNFNTRNGPFFGTLLFCSGYFISSLKPSEKWIYYGLAIFLIGWLIHFSEIYFLWALYKVSLIHDYVFGTYLMGVGAALMALSNHQLLRNKSLSGIGQLTLGIYASHYIFVDLFKYIDADMANPVWEVGYVFIVLFLSVGLTKYMSKIKYINKVVV